jgi:6,7-dimethyl-8-ribityllumazine synthase
MKQGRIEGSGRKFVVITSRWNELVTKALHEGAVETLTQAGATVEEISVPGTWEIPVALRAVLNRAEKPAGIVALGCILQGQTTHAQLLAGDVAGALMSLQVETGIPIAWGILTPDTAEQALDRAGMKMGNKGREAASAALEMADLVSQL